MYVNFGFDYQEKLEEIYINARWEAYYDLVLIPFISKYCEDKGVKIVPVHETRRSGRKSSNPKPHFIDNYSTMAEVMVKGKQTVKRVGIPDYVIVPSASTYENPKKSLVNIEFKLPEKLTTNYCEINPNKYETELSYQFRYCNNIILTDGVTWYFLKKISDIKTSEAIRLYDNVNKHWKYDNEATVKLCERISSFVDMALENNELCKV